jgi:hypothetical protein
MDGEDVARRIVTRSAETLSRYGDLRRLSEQRLPARMEPGPAAPDALKKAIRTDTFERGGKQSS